MTKKDIKRLDRIRKINRLVENDIADIRQGLYSDDIEFLDRVLRGDGWKPYNQLSDKQIEIEYNGRGFPID